MKREIYFAGGCFWGTARVFSLIDGVETAECGYANGSVASPSYEQVYTDSTGHAETVRVVYNPAAVSLEFLLDVFFSVIDPLALNRQGEDVGTRYRTGVYYTSEEDLAAIRAAFAAATERVGQSLATELEPLRCFFPAEEYHQDYLLKNPGGYCHIPLKVFAYLRILQDLRALLGDEPDMIARMANAAALLHEKMHFFWTGFYIVREDQLVLGPFQGPVACTRIAFGRGVCGTAWQQARTIVVPDVEDFPGHIACNPASRSEIVVPLLRSGSVTSVLDIDSSSLATFDPLDALWLEKIVKLI